MMMASENRARYTMKSNPTLEDDKRDLLQVTCNRNTRSSAKDTEQPFKALDEGPCAGRGKSQAVSEFCEMK